MPEASLSDHLIHESNPAALRRLQAQLSQGIGQRTAGDEDRATAIPGLSFFRREKLAGPSPCLIEPSIVLVVQGTKQLLIGDRAYLYDAEHFLIASLDLPGSSQVLEASTDTPCLGLTLRLDLRIIAELVSHVHLPAPRARADDGSAAIGTVTTGLFEPVARLVALLGQPDEIEVLSPLIQREIHYRLLKSDVAWRLLQIASVGSQSHRIARAIDWMKINYARPLIVHELAAYVQMSTSTLHHHFRQMTAMSPLQYQKWMRLNEARRLMLNEDLDAANASFQVRYDSPSQFSREYSRQFGTPPRRDVATLKQQAGRMTQQVTANA